MGAAILTLLFTPLGFWYKDQIAVGFMWLVAVMILAVATGGMSIFLTLPASMIHAYAIDKKGDKP